VGGCGVRHPVDLHKGYHAADGGQAWHRGRGRAGCAGRLYEVDLRGDVALCPRRDRAAPGRRAARAPGSHDVDVVLLEQGRHGILL
jgi:hypothetical protein